MRRLMAVLAICATSVAARADTASAPLGQWVTASGNLIVDIEPCGKALCGTTAKVLGNRSMEDSRIQMSAKAAIGMKILSDFVPSGDGEWQGQIYNRENGKTYDCIMRFTAPDQLTIRPYIVLSLFGQTQVWHRP